MNDEIIYYIDKLAESEHRLEKAIEILGSSSIDICPNEFGLADPEQLCPEHKNCQRCWGEGLKTIK